MQTLSLYVLTYNTPKQFEYWCAAFAVAYPSVFEQCAKFVINNSDDPKTQSAYQQLFATYHFTQIPVYANTGICGGRFLAAQHFDKSEAAFMVFFEDDMLMRKNTPKLCKAGFRTHHPQLFETCVEIMAREQLSFLKLCFSEVYGFNSQNWASIAFVEVEERKQVLGVEAGIMPFAPVYYLNTFEGLPYAVGNFHYCNWPIVFTKAGNHAVFLANVDRFKHESSWMKAVFYAVRAGNLRSACLLASPILHYRKHSYRPQDRVENEYGQKIRGVKICRDKN